MGIVMGINYESLKVMGKFALFMVLLLLIVYFLAVSTPWLAKKIDKILKKPERVADDNKNGAYDFEKDDIASPFGAQINNENNNGDDLYNGKE